MHDLHKEGKAVHSTSYEESMNIINSLQMKPAQYVTVSQSAIKLLPSTTTRVNETQSKCSKKEITS